VVSSGCTAKDEVEIRPLDRSQWESFRELRLHALKTEPGLFASSYASEVTKSPEGWQETIHAADHQAFGLFAHERLIGITAAFTSRDDPSGETALLAMSFILPEYRGRGLSHLFYDARLGWIRAQPKFRRVIVSHRLCNEASRKANQRHGFVVSRRAAKRWPDGVIEDEIFYQLVIR
jgi:RimJ/RimL family protein N-acetyltransferase